MNDSAARFLTAWKSIKETLRTEACQLGIDSKDFHDLLFAVADRNPIVHRHLRDLQRFFTIGEVIDGDETHEPVIEITSTAATHADAIAKLLRNPPLVDAEFKRDVLQVKPNDLLVGVLAKMKELAYSQAPVVSGDGTIKDLLTTVTISRWLANCVSDEIKYRKLRETRLDEVLLCAEDQNGSAKCFEIIRSKTNCSTVLKLFEEASSSGRHLDALIITANGAKNGEIVGIITEWDIPTVVEKTSISRLLSEVANKKNGNLFTAEGATFRIRFCEKEWTVKNSAGARYLRELLHHPREELRSGGLINRLNGDNHGSSASREQPEEFVAAQPGGQRGADPSIAIALRNYREHIKEIDEELGELERDGADFNRDRINTLLQDREDVLKSINSSTNIRGQPRMHKTIEDRGDTIRRAIQRCLSERTDKKNHPAVDELKKHVSQYMRFGTNCEYTPPPGTEWL